MKTGPTQAVGDDVAATRGRDELTLLLLLGSADTELGDLHLEAGADITRLIASLVVGLGLTGERAVGRGLGDECVVRATAASAAIALSHWGKHRSLLTVHPDAASRRVDPAERPEPQGLNLRSEC
jgi:hypothetical protein